MNASPTIGLIDDEPGMLRALKRLLHVEGFSVLIYDSADDFLHRPEREKMDCVVLDVSMPGLNGLELQQHLNSTGSAMPIIFLSGQGDIPTSVRAIKAGAVNFLTKPVNDLQLLAAIREALAIASVCSNDSREVATLREKANSLTARELEILREVITGKLNKQIAADLGISEQTVKVHRMHITAKMGMPSVAELTRAAMRLGIFPATET